MKQITTYRCNLSCPIKKKCFIIKTLGSLKEPVTVLFKCVAKKKDISLKIGGHDPPLQLYQTTLFH